MDARAVLLNYTPKQIYALPQDVIKNLAGQVGIVYSPLVDVTNKKLVEARNRYKQKIYNANYKAKKQAQIAAAKREAKAANIIKRTLKKSLAKPFRFVSMRRVDQIRYYSRFKFHY